MGKNKKSKAVGKNPESLKEAGNKCFLNGQFDEAINYYS